MFSYLLSNMKVCNAPIFYNYNYKPNFSGYDHEPNIIGFDEGGKAKRDYIRKWHEQNYIPYQSIYEKEGRLSEYEMKSLINKLTQKFKYKLDKIEKVNLYKVEPIDNNSYKGAMIRENELDKLPLLKEAGIKRIVDLEGIHNLENACKQNDLEYFYFYINKNDEALKNKKDIERNSRHYWQYISDIKNKNAIEKYVQDDIKKWSLAAKKSIQELVNFVNTMQKGDIFIGCRMGEDRTNTALMMNYLFNPKAQEYFSFGAYQRQFIGPLKNLYENLTDTNKLNMGWDKIFDEQFLPKLKELKYRV